MSERCVGNLKWYNEDKGYGFIQVSNSEKDIFVHAKQLRKSGIEHALQEGERVSFDMNQGVKGQYASNIKREV